MARKYVDIQVAKQVAIEAGAMIMADFRSGSKPTFKTDGSPVTATDVRVNQRVIEIIRKEFPTHDIMAEEGSYLRNRSSYRWICDPIDGTIAFSNEIPTSAFSLALAIKGRPVLGVVYDPFQDRMLSAELEGGAFLNGERIQVSDAKLARSVVGVACWPCAQFNLMDLHAKLVGPKISAAVLGLGSITYMGAFVAMGKFSANVHPATLPFDSAALKVIVEEAKGRVTDLFGNEQRYDRMINGCIMSNGIVHAELVRLIRRTACSGEFNYSE